MREHRSAMGPRVFCWWNPKAARGGAFGQGRRPESKCSPLNRPSKCPGRQGGQAGGGQGVLQVGRPKVYINGLTTRGLTGYFLSPFTWSGKGGPRRGRTLDKIIKTLCTAMCESRGQAEFWQLNVGWLIGILQRTVHENPAAGNKSHLSRSRRRPRRCLEKPRLNSGLETLAALRL